MQENIFALSFAATRGQFLQRRPIVGRNAGRSDGDGLLRRFAFNRGAGTGIGSRWRGVAPLAARFPVERRKHRGGGAPVVASSSASKTLLRPAAPTVCVSSCWHCLTEVYLKFIYNVWKRTTWQLLIPPPPPAPSSFSSRPSPLNPLFRPLLLHSQLS